MLFSWAYSYIFTVIIILISLNYVCMYTVVVNFNQSSYDIREDDDTVMIDLIMNRPSSQQFEITINLMDITTTGTRDIKIKLLM